MDARQIKKTSKFLSLILRHQPQTVGIKLDDAGWVDVDVLLQAVSEHNGPLSREALEEVVVSNDKQRFAFSDDGQRIRANQGHSVKIDLGYQAVQPPDVLYHGAPDKFVDAILKEGLKKMKRHHVHLHTDRETCLAVGQRRGRPVLLGIQAQAMFADGHEFFRSENGVWLTDHVPAQFIGVEPSEEESR